MSLRALSLKYDTPKTTIQNWAKKYQWDVKNRAGKPDSPSSGPTADPIAADVRSYEGLSEYTKKLLVKADQLLSLDEALAPRDLKSISSMLLDVKQLLGTMSPLEEEIQRVKLAAMKRQAEAEQSTAEVTVRFVDTGEAES